MFETVWDTLRFSRGLFGKKKDDAYLERLLRDLSLWDKRKSKIMTLSGGMKRRVLIGKALAHEPKLLFLDEPTAGVDVELRRDMWQLVADLRRRGVTIILTTHYIEEAEEMADRVGVIAQGQIILVEDKLELMKRFGKKTLTVHFKDPLETVPESLKYLSPRLEKNGLCLQCTFSSEEPHSPVVPILRELEALQIQISDVETVQSSLEEIFVNLVHDRKVLTPSTTPAGSSHEAL
jgi:ABC-2 type transport system ATP-binding protein